MNGPGKYDEICTVAREAARAKGAIVLIFDGMHGSGFSAQLPAELKSMIADVLRQVVHQIEGGEWTVTTETPRAQS